MRPRGGCRGRPRPVRIRAVDSGHTNMLMTMHQDATGGPQKVWEGWGCQGDPSGLHLPEKIKYYTREGKRGAQAIFQQLGSLEAKAVDSRPTRLDRRGTRVRMTECRRRRRQALFPVESWSSRVFRMVAGEGEDAVRIKKLGEGSRVDRIRQTASGGPQAGRQSRHDGGAK